MVVGVSQLRVEPALPNEKQDQTERTERVGETAGLPMQDQGEPASEQRSHNLHLHQPVLLLLIFHLGAELSTGSR